MFHKIDPCAFILQPSLSLDNTVEVFLLKNEGEFISVEQGQKNEKKKQREDNIRQLLDVTNTITSEEIRDFEMRFVSKFIELFGQQMMEKKTSRFSI